METNLNVVKTFKWNAGSEAKIVDGINASNTSQNATQPTLATVIKIINNSNPAGKIRGDLNQIDISIQKPVSNANSTNSWVNTNEWTTLINFSAKNSSNVYTGSGIISFIQTGMKLSNLIVNKHVGFIDVLAAPTSNVTAGEAPAANTNPTLVQVKNALQSINPSTVDGEILNSLSIDTRYTGTNIGSDQLKANLYIQQRSQISF